MSNAEVKENIAVIVVKAVTLLLMILVGAAGNITVMTIVWKDSRMHTPRNIILLSSSVADLILSCAVMPLNFISLAYGRWIFGDVICHATALLSAVFARVTVLTITSVVYEKFRFLRTERFPYLTRRVLSFIVALVWSVPWLFGVVYVFYLGQIDYQDPRGNCYFILLDQLRFASVLLIGVEVAMFVFFPLLCLAYCFWQIFRNSLSPGRAAPDIVQQHLRGRRSLHRRSVRSLLLFSAVSLILLYPYLIAQFVHDALLTDGRGGLPAFAKTATLWIFWLQCALKPVIYLFINEKSYRFLQTQSQRLCKFWSRSKVRHLEAQEVAIVSRAQRGRSSSSRRKYERRRNVGRRPGQPVNHSSVAEARRLSIDGERTPNARGPFDHHAWVLPRPSQPSSWSSFQVDVTTLE